MALLFFFELGKKVIDMADSHILVGENASVLWINKWSLNYYILWLFWIIESKKEFSLSQC